MPFKSLILFFSLSLMFTDSVGPQGYRCLWRDSRELRQAVDDPQYSGQERSQSLPPGSVHEEPGRLEGGDEGRGEGGDPEGLGEPEDHEERRDGPREDAPGARQRERARLGGGEAAEGHRGRLRPELPGGHRAQPGQGDQVRRDEERRHREVSDGFQVYQLPGC